MTDNDIRRHAGDAQALLLEMGLKYLPNADAIGYLLVEFDKQRAVELPGKEGESDEQVVRC